MKTMIELPISKESFADLFTYLYHLPIYEKCDGETLKYTKRFISKRFKDKNIVAEVCAYCNQTGGYCDCEVLLNTAHYVFPQKEEFEQYSEDAEKRWKALHSQQLNVPAFVRVVLNGEKYYLRYKDLKKHELQIIEDNMFHGMKCNYSEDEILSYEVSAKKEFRMLREAIAKNHDIILTLDFTTERFVPIDETHTGNNTLSTISLPLILAGKDWDDNKIKSLSNSKYYIAKLSDKFVIIKKKTNQISSKLTGVGFTTAEEAQNFLIHYGEIAKKVNQNKLNNAILWVNTHPEVINQLEFFRGKKKQRKQIKKLLKSYGIPNDEISIWSIQKAILEVIK